MLETGEDFENEEQIADGTGRITRIGRAILGLAKRGLSTTAEGFERSQQLEYHSAKGCNEGQGYLFSKVIPATAIPALLSHYSDAEIG